MFFLGGGLGAQGSSLSCIGVAGVKSECAQPILIKAWFLRVGELMRPSEERAKLVASN